jgi:hypothetical protein
MSEKIRLRAEGAGRPAKEGAVRKNFKFAGTTQARLDELVKAERLRNPKTTETDIVERAIMTYKVEE